MRELADRLADQLAWFRREDWFADPVRVMVRMARNGQIDGMAVLAFIDSEAVDLFLQVREPQIAPHATDERVIQAISAANKRSGWAP